MNIVNENFALQFAQEWVNAWNAHDVERVLSHYAEAVEFQSPYVITLAGEPSGCLTGKAALRSYWSGALAKLPGLHFVLEDVLIGVGSLTLYYQGHRGRVAETFFFDASLKVMKATACYSATPIAPSTQEK